MLHKFDISPTKPGPFFRQEKRLVKRNADGTTGKVTATDQQNDSLYTCPVQIGTPPQTLNLDFDSGSSDLWVWSTKLPANVESEGSSHKIFDPSQSSTFQNQAGSTFEVHYGDQSYAKGTVGTDTVQIGNITIQGQAVELADDVSSSFIQDASSDGLLGLAFGTLNTVQPDPVATPVQNMINQDDIPQNEEIFSVYLSSIKDQNEPSFYTFGAIDTSAVPSGSQITYTPVDKPIATHGKQFGFWRFASPSATVNGQTINLPGNKAIADTGTTLLMTSDEVCQKIYEAIPGAYYDQNQQGYIFPANTDPDTLPTVTFMVGNTPITIAKNLLAWAPGSDGSTVYGGIQSRGDQDFDIFGDTFLQNVYAVFDVGNLRFGCVQRQVSTPSTSTNA